MIRLSICVPTYQRAVQLRSMLKRLLDDVSRHSRRGEIEICISDNCSTDDTPEVIAASVAGARHLNIQHQRQSANVGFAGNFASLIQMATGTGFIILADDDTLEPLAIEQLLLSADRLRIDQPLILFNTLPGGDARDRSMSLPLTEMVFDGPDVALSCLGIFHTSFVSNMMFDRQAALQFWREEMKRTRYPHAALAAELLASRPALFLPIAITKVSLPPDAWDQPLLTSVDMARLQTTYVLADVRCRRLVGWVYRFLIRMLPTAIYLQRIGRCAGDRTNPYADLRLKNVRECYRRSLVWQTIATFLWCFAMYLPVSWLGGLLRLWSRHQR